MKTPSQTTEAELEDLEVHEVSVVDRPANRRKFLLIKRDAGIELLEEDMPKELEVELDHDTLLGLVEETCDDADDCAAPVVKTETTTAADAVLGIIGSLTEAVSVLKEEKPDSNTPETIRDQLKSVTQALVDLVGRLTKGEPKEPAGDSSADNTESAKMVGDALKMATACLERLMSVVNRLKEMDPEEKKIPAPIVNELRSVATMLGKIVTSYGTAPDGYGDAPKDAAAGADAPKEAAKDADAQPKEKRVEQIKVFTAKGDGQEIIIKVGAKMKKVRFAQFKRAVETLKAILSELEAPEQKDEAVVTKAAPVELPEAINKLVERLDKIEANLATVSKRIDDVDATVPAGKGDASPEEVAPDKVEKKQGLWDNIICIP